MCNDCKFVQNRSPGESPPWFLEAFFLHAHPIKDAEVTQDLEETQLKREEDDMIHHIRTGSICNVLAA